MLTTINLLSTADKEAQKKHTINTLVIKTAGVLFTTIITLTLLATGAKILLEKTWSKIQQTDYAGSTEFNANIKHINTLSAFINTLESSHHAWSEVIVTLANTAPPGVSFTALRLDGAKETLSLQGVARERADLLALQNNLERVPLVREVTIPLQDLSEKTNLLFNLTLQLNTDTF